MGPFGSSFLNPAALHLSVGRADPFDAVSIALPSDVTRALPIRRSKSQVPRQSAGRACPPSDVRSRQRLGIDSERSNTVHLSCRLGHHGHSVGMVTDGTEAHTSMETGKEQG